MTRVQFNSGTWTDEEHQGFLRGLEVHGRGSWEAIGGFVSTRSPLQIEEHAQQHFAAVEPVHPEEVPVAQPARSGEAHLSLSATSSSPSPPLGNGGGGGGGDAGSDAGSDRETPVVATGASGDVVPAGLVPVANDGASEQQQQQQQQQQTFVHEEGHQAGEPIGSLMAHTVPYPNPLVWEEPALGAELRRYFGVVDYCGIL